MNHQRKSPSWLSFISLSLSIRSISDFVFSSLTLCSTILVGFLFVIFSCDFNLSKNVFTSLRIFLWFDDVFFAVLIVSGTSLIPFSIIFFSTGGMSNGFTSLRLFLGTELNLSFLLSSFFITFSFFGGLLILEVALAAPKFSFLLGLNSLFSGEILSCIFHRASMSRP